jgi:hypothetical protein
MVNTSPTNIIFVVTWYRLSLSFASSPCLQLSTLQTTFHAKLSSMFVHDLLISHSSVSLLRIIHPHPMSLLQKCSNNELFPLFCNTSTVKQAAYPAKKTATDVDAPTRGPPLTTRREERLKMGYGTQHYSQYAVFRHHLDTCNRGDNKRLTNVHALHVQQKHVGTVN